MKQIIFSIHDKAAQVYTTPFFEHNRALAIRALATQVTNKDGLLNSHPEDFVLYKLAEYDDATGTITPHEPEKVITIEEIKRMQDG